MCREIIIMCRNDTFIFKVVVSIDSVDTVIGRERVGINQEIISIDGEIVIIDK
jgi:hypothetical protein